MRVLAITFAALALAGPAVAATPRFALYDLQSDLAHASRNEYGDVLVKPLPRVAGKGTAVRCGPACRFGAGWLAFAAKPHLAPADVARAKAGYSKHDGWTVELSLRPRAVARWDAFRERTAAAAKLRGVPDVLVVVAGGQIAAAPLASEVATSHGAVTLTGFSRASAKSLARLLG
jgi:hypothetical protein